MRRLFTILIFYFAILLVSIHSHAEEIRNVIVDFYGYHISFSAGKSFLPELNSNADSLEVRAFLSILENSEFKSCINSLLDYKAKEQPDDWLYYQLVRKTAQAISPKSANYKKYTLYKYFLMAKSGFNVMLTQAGDKMLFYIQSDENIYNIPYRSKNGRNYICLNFHDYKNLDFEKEKFLETVSDGDESNRSFSYKITRLPEFPKEGYVEKEINFNYYQSNYNFKVKLNPLVKNIFHNYPVVDYSDYLNIPLSTITYQSLIPVLKKELKGMNVKDGVDYLMRFTRYSFSYESDTRNFGNEKRLSPEQTLLYDKSDCDDRVALCYFLVKEIYDLPMIVVSYPEHVTLAIAFDKPVGKPVIYNGVKYSFCEPTPQKEDLPIGYTLPELKHSQYEIVYAYQPRLR